MSQFQAPFDEPEAQPQRKTSGLAVTSFVCSAIFCCPVTTVIGVILGLVAAVMIAGSPFRKGMAWAAAAIVIGLLATVLQVGGGYWAYEVMWKPVIVGPGDALVAGFAGDVAAFKGGFHGSGAAATDAEAVAFIEQLRLRYGEFVSCELSPVQDSQTAFGQTALPFAYRIRFDNATVDAEAEMIFSDPAGGGFIMKFGYLTVFDAELGDLTFPSAQSPPSLPPAPEVPGEAEPDGGS